MSLSRPMKFLEPETGRQFAPRKNNRKEIDECTNKLVPQPLPQRPQNLPSFSASFSGQQVSESVQNVPKLPLNSGFDRDSAMGRFTWAPLAHQDKYLPCIFRNGEKYVSVRIAEVSEIGKLLNILPSGLYQDIKIKSFYATATEAMLLNHINSWHCDDFYGTKAFSIYDTVIGFVDLRNFYKFILFTIRVLRTGESQADSQNCGFLRVNSKPYRVPYTVLQDGEKGVPLFCFKGNDIRILEEKAFYISGLPLAYLKFCCGLIRIRKELMASFQIVKLSTVKATFPKSTAFDEECWPEFKPHDLPDVNSTKTYLGTIGDRWTELGRNRVFSNDAPVKKDHATDMDKCFGDQIPSFYIWKCAALGLKERCDVGKCQRRLIQVPELTERFKEVDYVLKHVQLYNYLIPCVNAKPGQYDEFFMGLAGIQRLFFPNQSVYPTLVSALWSVGILTYLPNESQMKAFSNAGLHVIDPVQSPMVLASESSNAVNKLREIMIKPSAMATLASLINQPGNFVILE